MNREYYEQYHKTGGTYVIPVEVFNELIEETAQLKNENMQFKKKNMQLQKQLDYIRSGEYYNQLRFENEMLQEVIDTNGVPSELYDYIDCTHKNTELLEEMEYLKTALNTKEEMIKQAIPILNKISEYANSYDEAMECLKILLIDDEVKLKLIDKCIKEIDNELEILEKEEKDDKEVISNE